MYDVAGVFIFASPKAGMATLAHSPPRVTFLEGEAGVHALSAAILVERCRLNPG